MPHPNEATSAATSIKWRKEYRHYRSSRCRLYLCMISLMVFIALSVVCATFLFRNSFYFHPKDYELNRGEMRVVKVSTLFCEGVVVKPDNFKRQIIVISPPLERRAAQTKLMSSEAVLLRRDRSWYRSFYLLKGSTVSVRIVSQHSINVYWLTGRRVLDKWSDEMRKELKESSKQNTEKFTATSMAETFTVNEDKNYYLGITSIAGNTKYSEIFVNLSIHHMMYDVSTFVTSCNAGVGESCEVKLRFNLPDSAVLVVPNNTTTLPAHDVWVSWYCKPRIWFYAVMFGGSFLFVFILMSLLYCCIMSRVKKKIRKWKPHVVAVRRENTENGGVTLTSINVRGSTLDNNCENILELTPLRLTSARDEATDTCQENNKPDMPLHSTPNGLHRVDVANNSFSCSSTGLTLFDDANYVDFATKHPENTTLWRSPSPRWSTFLSADDYEECVTNFRESPNNTLDSMEKESEDNNFESELMDRFQNTEDDEPLETDIDNVESETNWLLNDPVNNAEVVMRQKEKRKEQRWEPRLSVVTEI